MEGSFSILCLLCGMGLCQINLTPTLSRFMSFNSYIRSLRGGYYYYSSTDEGNEAQRMLRICCKPHNSCLEVNSDLCLEI